MFQGEDVVVTYETMTNPLNIHNVNILVQKMIEKDAKTFNDVFVLKRDREQIAAEYGISPEALRQRARRVEMKVRLIVSKLLG